MAPISPDLLHSRTGTTFLTLSWIEPGGSEISEFRPSAMHCRLLQGLDWETLQEPAVHLLHARTESTFSSLVIAKIAKTLEPEPDRPRWLRNHRICSTPERNQCFRPCLNAPRTPRASSFCAILERNQRFRPSAVHCSLLIVYRN